MTRVNNHNSSFFNINANVLSAFMYGFICILGFTPFLNYWCFAFPLVIYGIEKKSSFVKRNALQAFVIGLFSSIIYFLLLFISEITKPWCNDALTRCYGSAIIYKTFSEYGSIRWMIAGFIFVVCLILAIRAYNYEDYQLDCISTVVDKIGNFFDKLLGSKNNIHEETKKENINKEKKDAEIKEESITKKKVVKPKKSKKTTLSKTEKKVTTKKSK